MHAFLIMFITPLTIEIDYMLSSNVLIQENGPFLFIIKFHVFIKTNTRILNYSAKTLTVYMQAIINLLELVYLVDYSLFLNCPFSISMNILESCILILPF